jgi:hypothetical protein
MKDYRIVAGEIEELQMLNNSAELEKIFEKAKAAIVNGASVIFLRRDSSGQEHKFDEMDTLEDLELYKQQVFKYIK